MKSFPIISKPFSKYHLIGNLIIVLFLSISFNTTAQTPLVGNETNKIKNAKVVQLSNSEYDIIIPTINRKDLKDLEQSVFNQLIFVVDQNSGYYFFTGSSWEKQSIREVFELIDINLAIQEPQIESIIMVAVETDSSPLLDYNNHIKNVYYNFVFDETDKSMAVLIGQR